MKVLVTADWHISGTRPRCRADEDWIATQAKDIEAVWKIAKDQRVEAVWILGDLFDTSRVATEAVNLVLREFEKAPCPVYTLCGNHDLPYHSFDLLERSSIGTVLHKFQMLATDTSTGVAAYPFGKEPEYGALSDYMKASGLHTWITHQLTFPDEASRPIAGIGVLAQELLDACPAASVILTGDYHHGNIYTAPDGRRVITPGIQGKVETAYLEHEHALEDMKEKFIASLETGAIKMKSFSEALEEVMPTLSPGVRKVLDEVKESLVPA